MTHTSCECWTEGDTVVQVFSLSEAPCISTVPWLFFRHDQIATQTPDVIYSFILTSKAVGGILAVFHCTVNQPACISPPCAPFGGLLPLGSCNVRQLTFLLSCIRWWAKSRGARSVTVKTAPSCYDFELHQTCHRAYLAARFFPVSVHSNHYITIEKRDFSQIIERPEQRRLAKGKSAGIRVQISKGAGDAAALHLLQKCYHARCYRMSISAEQWTRCAQHDPSCYLIMVAALAEEPVAAGIFVRVGEGVLYHFASGYLPAFGALSPSLHLFEAAYRHCQNERMALLDLGISVDHDGKHKPSLSRFKSRIGGLTCEKIVYEAQL